MEDGRVVLEDQRRPKVPLCHTGLGERFWLAQMVSEHKGNDDVPPMFKDTKKRAGKVPSTLDFMRNRLRSRIITNKFISFRSITHKVY